eukprot:CAMPEP_0174376554 /NCGR_PEP_ID=MMETSP0811_2-20130205/118556_1 /TAXON_ID=73025 ORGANISM="Eutreptiella gymnastica-like, Strain CCMP1594" /NCGR_SAMPLE_ID=MMETSP0811_2 /ASSEMBLY_ACC=CAM_ASM_000667 /LENGTH=50 /DNA_ID=CAMNT_0015527829 /DNA_START=419 /DNA_END=568 /DNA_ORIENTATION=-
MTLCVQVGVQACWSIGGACGSGLLHPSSWASPTLRAMVPHPCPLAGDSCH